MIQKGKCKECNTAKENGSRDMRDEEKRVLVQHSLWHHSEEKASCFHLQVMICFFIKIHDHILDTEEPTVIITIQKNSRRNLLVQKKLSDVR